MHQKRNSDFSMIKNKKSKQSKKIFFPDLNYCKTKGQELINLQIIHALQPKHKDKCTKIAAVDTSNTCAQLSKKPSLDLTEQQKKEIALYQNEVSKIYYDITDTDYKMPVKHCNVTKKAYDLTKKNIFFITNHFQAIMSIQNPFSMI